MAYRLFQKEKPISANGADIKVIVRICGLSMTASEYETYKVVSWREKINCFIDWDCNGLVGCSKELDCKQVFEHTGYFLYTAENGTQYRIDEICDFQNPDIKCIIINESYNMFSEMKICEYK